MSGEVDEKEVRVKALKFLNLTLEAWQTLGKSTTTETSEDSESSEESENSEESETSEDSESSENTEDSETLGLKDFTEAQGLKIFFEVDPTPDEWGPILRLVEPVLNTFEKK